jgi:hypothetical protein
MTKILGRVALVVGGGFLLLANNGGGGEGTVLGFYPPDNAQRLGYNLSKVLIAALALWIIYRGIRPKRRTASAGATPEQQG